VRLGFQNLSQTDRSFFGFSSFRFRGYVLSRWRGGRYACRAKLAVARSVDRG